MQAAARYGRRDTLGLEQNLCDEDAEEYCDEEPHGRLLFGWCASELYTRARRLACCRPLRGIDACVKIFLRTCACIGVAIALAGASVRADTLGHRAGAVVHDAFIYAAVRGHLVDVDHGVVTLSGQARTVGERTRYVAAAESVSGVTSVRDSIVVDPQLRGPSETTRDDALATRVYAALVAQSGVNAFHVSAHVRGGVVTLQGSVPNRAVEQTMLTTAQGVSGVRSVVNDLTVSG
jgi:osmotically-inducible protein OsmY